jgi:hypothetical protein
VRVAPNLAPGLAAIWPCTVVDVARTWAELEQLMLKIARDAPEWRARGITLAVWGPKAELNKVLIELRSPTEAAAQALYDTYGADWITVSPEPNTLELRLLPVQRPSDP